MPNHSRGYTPFCLSAGVVVFSEAYYITNLINHLNGRSILQHRSGNPFVGV